VEGGEVYDEQKCGDGGSLRDTDRDGSKEARGPLEHQAAGTNAEEGANPLDQVWANPFSVKDRKELGRLHVIEAPLHIKEESGDFIAEPVEELNIVW